MVAARRDRSFVAGGGWFAWWWVILRCMSLDALVAEVGQALSGARRLFGEAPLSGVWGSTGTLGGSRDAVSRASGAAGRNWQGAAGSRYVSASGGGGGGVGLWGGAGG